jgi:DNA-binding CsgD family transcriptional regulator
MITIVLADDHTHLGISPKTVDTHRTHVMATLNRHTCADLTHYAVQHGDVVTA